MKWKRSMAGNGFQSMGEYGGNEVGKQDEWNEMEQGHKWSLIPITPCQQQFFSFPLNYKENWFIWCSLTVRVSLSSLKINDSHRILFSVYEKYSNQWSITLWYCEIHESNRAPYRNRRLVSYKSYYELFLTHFILGTLEFTETPWNTLLFVHFHAFGPSSPLWYLDTP